MTETERQILLNQFVIMAFLHGVHLKDISGYNEDTFCCLRQCIDKTKEILERKAEPSRGSTSE